MAYPLEVAYLPQGNLPGRYAIGAIHDTSDREDLAFDDEGRLARLTGRPLRRRNDRRQLYATFDQMVWRAGEGRTNGAIVFGGVTVEPDEVAAVDRTWFLGTSVRGIVPGRPDDNVGLQVTRLHFSDAARAADRAASLADDPVPRDRATETVLEAHYGVQFTDRARLAPNVQYVRNANGDGEDGAVWGLRLDVSF